MMTTVTSEYRQYIPRTVWMTARARNALRRPAFIGTISIATFVVALVVMVVMPQRTERAAGSLAPKATEWPDTAALLAVADTASDRLARANEALDSARARAVRLSSVVVADLDSAAGRRRESLRAGIATINGLLARAENAPLPSSYRAIAEAPQLASDARIRALLDTLGEIEKERETASAVGGADPVFVALTAKATEIGRAIQAVAAAHRDDMQRALAALTPAAPPASGAELAAADTIAHIARRDTALAAFVVTSAELARARRQTLALQERADRARELATMTAPPLALLVAAVVFGGVLGFGVALISEIRRPRVADEHEAEWAAGVRVLAVVVPRPPPPERARRSADRAAPPYIDPAADSHRLVYLTAVTAGANLLMVTFTGSEPPIAAVVAANFAAIAAEEARNTVLIDADARTCAVASALRLRATPGIVDIIDGRVEWSEATVQATIGRDRTIDVVPSGTAQPLPDPAEVTKLLRRDAPRLARHYDAILILATVEQALGGLPGVLPIGDAIYCARIGHTRLRELRQAIEGLRLAGGNPLGVVLWDGEPPAMVTPAEFAAGDRPMRTAEMPIARVAR